MYDVSSDNSEEWISADLSDLVLFILMISQLKKKVLMHCIKKTDSDYNRIKKFNQLVRKRTIKHLTIVRLNS